MLLTNVPLNIKTGDLSPKSSNGVLASFVYGCQLIIPGLLGTGKDAKLDYELY